MRDLLQSLINGGEKELTKRIASEKNVITTSCRLSSIQQDALFPPNNALVNYDSLDFTLMYTICRNVLNNEIELYSKSKRRWGKSRWGQFPHSSDTSLLAAIERIRECRNTFFAHATSSQLNNKTFNKTWLMIENAVITIDDKLDRKIISTRYKNEIKKLKQSSTDPKLRKTMMDKIELERRYINLSEMEGIFTSFVIFSLFSPILSFIFKICLSLSYNLNLNISDFLSGMLCSLKSKQKNFFFILYCSYYR